MREEDGKFITSDEAHFELTHYVHKLPIFLAKPDN
jgi:hypothetical protein